jgi:hypothetical protein
LHAKPSQIFTRAIQLHKSPLNWKISLKLKVKPLRLESLDIISPREITGKLSKPQGFVVRIGVVSYSLLQAFESSCNGERFSEENSVIIMKIISQMSVLNIPFIFLVNRNLGVRHSKEKASRFMFMYKRLRDLCEEKKSDFN